MSLPVVESVAGAPPEEVKIRLLQPCDLRCGMCWHWQDPQGAAKRLETDVLVKLLEELGRMGTARVKLTGGEPLLRRDLVDLVAAARAAGLEVILGTNAATLTPTRADALVGAGVGTFHVSLDADDAAVHDDIRGVPGSFERTVGALTYLSGAHPGVKRKLVAVFQRRNIGHLAGLVSLAASKGVGQLYLIAVHTQSWCANDRPTPEQYRHFFFGELPTILEAGLEHRVLVFPSPLFESLLGEDTAARVAALRAAASNGGGPFAAQLAAYAAEEYGRFFYADKPCREIQARAEVAETGDVYPCCHTERPELSMGNIRTERFADIWARGRYRAFRDPEGPLPRHPICLTCKDSHYPT